MDLDDKGVDRAGNPDFLTLDRPSPVGAFAFNTVLVNIGKSTLEHRPGWDKLGTSRAHVFRRDD
jgi:anaerobic dimethyl sulfoxide reductase subunit A